MYYILEAIATVNNDIYTWLWLDAFLFYQGEIAISYKGVCGLREIKKKQQPYKFHTNFDVPFLSSNIFKFKGELMVRIKDFPGDVELFIFFN